MIRQQTLMLGLGGTGAPLCPDLERELKNALEARSSQPLPAQWTNGAGEVPSWMGPRRLRVAMIRQAMMDLASSNPLEREHARRWIARDDDSWSFSFTQICQVLDINVEAAREAIRRINKEFAGKLAPGLRGQRH
jgi:hypothetical protein